MPFKVGDRVIVSGTEDDTVLEEHLGQTATVYDLGTNYEFPGFLGRDYRIIMNDGYKYIIWEKNLSPFTDEFPYFEANVSFIDSLIGGAK